MIKIDMPAIQQYRGSETQEAQWDMVRQIQRNQILGMLEKFELVIQRWEEKRDLLPATARNAAIQADVALVITRLREKAAEYGSL